MSALEARLAELETRETSVPDEALVARMEALQADGVDVAGQAALSDMEARLDDLAARIASLETAPASDESFRAELDTLRDRVGQMSAVPVAAAAPARASGAIAPTFPAETLRDGARARAGGGLLAKHFRVRSDDDPLTLIDAVETAMDERRYADAVAAFDRLPDELKSLARGWRADMQSFLP